MSHKEFFYTEPENITGSVVEIKGEELRHLSRVLRKKVRDIINVVDGKGNLYTALLTEITKNVARGEIQKRARFVGEANFRLILAQAVPKANRFDLVVEKGTEIGVSAFIPLSCEHSVVETTPARLSRWKKVAVAAMKQCGRTILPEILPPQSVREVVEKRGLLKLGLIAHAEGRSKSLTQLIGQLKTQKNPAKSAVILIGPEGGFSDEEVSFAIDNGFEAFTLGPRRLRSETAGVVSAAIFMELVGNMV